MKVHCGKVRRTWVMDQKVYNLTVALIFTLVALIHLYRFVTGTELIMASYSLPLTASLGAFIVLGFLAFRGFQLAKS